jgi:class 3 adenylate cyclase/HAMP domain-containing protein
MKKSKNEKIAKKGTLIYRIVGAIPILTKLVRKGGIRLKWTLIVSSVMAAIIAIVSLFYTMMTTAALKQSARQLCQTIAGNISSTESIITAEKSEFKRSVILQDIVTGLKESNITGLAYAAVYDISGKLAENERAYAAHTKSEMRGKAIPEFLYQEISRVYEFQEDRVSIKNEQGQAVDCFRYRMPFNFFKIRVGVIEVAFIEESILGFVNKMIIYMAIIGGLFLILGIMVSIATTKGMVKPIKSLSQTINKVREGDLGILTEIYRHDEIGDLSDEFNTLIVHLREKLHMQKFVSDSTISMIKQHSSSADINLGGTRENLTFLFSDVRGFTSLSEKLDPEQVVSVLNRYLDLQSIIIKKNNGDIDKFVGDEVMAAFHGPNKTDDALTAAIEIIQKVDELNKERAKKKLLTLTVGIGIHGGDVVHGRMGARDRMDQTSIGDAVNLAARLCSNADPGTILASKDILTTATKGKFNGKKLEPINVKGKSKPIDIYMITGKK